MVRRKLFRRTVWLLVVLILSTACSDGEEGSSREPASSVRKCLAPPCGNGEVDCEEACDDGNPHAYDACLPNCELARCGDGLLRTEYPDGCEAPNDDESCPRFETCDDGNDVDGDGCSGTCQIEE